MRLFCRILNCFVILGPYLLIWTWKAKKQWRNIYVTMWSGTNLVTWNLPTLSWGVCKKQNESIAAQLTRVTISNQNDKPLPHCQVLSLVQYILLRVLWKATPLCYNAAWQGTKENSHTVGRQNISGNNSQRWFTGNGCYVSQLPTNTAIARCNGVEVTRHQASTKNMSSKPGHLLNWYLTSNSQKKEGEFLFKLSELHDLFLKRSWYCDGHKQMET